MGKKKINPEVQANIDKIMNTGNFTLEEAVSIAENWSRKLPDDPNEQLKDARNAVGYERGMQMLNWQLRHHEINQAEYNRQEEQLYKKYHPKK